METSSYQQDQNKNKNKANAILIIMNAKKKKRERESWMTESTSSISLLSRFRRNTETKDEVDLTAASLLVDKKKMSATITASTRTALHAE